MEKKLLLNWIGSFSQGQGYSGSGENICVALEKLGLDVRMIGFSKTIDENLTPEGKALRYRPFIKSDIGICYGFPNAFSSLRDYKYKIGFTMFETDKLPEAAVWAGKDGVAASCNVLDALFVPCQHNVELFRKSGVTVPIYVVHLGVNPDLYPFFERPRNRKPFTFLELGTLTIRKNPGYVLSAFLSLFSDSKDVKLLLKTQSGTLGHLELPFKNVEIIDRYSTIDENLQHYKDADCFVLPSRGEGFGLPPLEAMATGMPVIIAKNTGLLEFADERYVYTIRSAGKQKAWRYPTEWGDVGNWYESSFSDLKKKMLYVYTHREEAYEKGIVASWWVRDNFTFDKTAKRIVELIADITK